MFQQQQLFIYVQIIVLLEQQPLLVEIFMQGEEDEIRNSTSRWSN